MNNNDIPILVAQGTDLTRMTLGDLREQISLLEYMRVVRAHDGEWIDFGGGAAAQFSVCRVDQRA